MTPEHPSLKDGLHHARFSVGPYAVIGGMSPRVCQEEQRYCEGSIEAILKESFIEHTRPLTLWRTGEISTLLHNASTLYFLDAHGFGHKGQWCFAGGEEGNERKFNVHGHLQRMREEERIDAAIIVSCNPEKNPAPAFLPIFYSTDESSMGNFYKQGRLVLPEREQEQPLDLERVLSFVAGLGELKKSVHREMGLDFLSENTDKSYARWKRKIQKMVGIARHYDPCQVNRYEGVTFITHSGTEYAIKDGCMKSTNKRVDGLEVKAIGSVCELQKEKLDQPYLLLREEGMAGIIPVLQKPRYGSCLFFRYGFTARVDWERYTPYLFTSPIVDIKWRNRGKPVVHDKKIGRAESL